MSNNKLNHIGMINRTYFNIYDNAMLLFQPKDTV